MILTCFRQAAFKQGIRLIGKLGEYILNKMVEEKHSAHARDKQIPLDLHDPHRAALEDNPEHAGRPPVKTMLAVVVRGTCLT